MPNFWRSIIKKFVDITKQCFCPITSNKLSRQYLNFHRRQRWWDRIQAIFLNLFYFKCTYCTLIWIQLFYPLRFSEYFHGLAFAVNLLWNWCVTDCFDQSKTTFVVIFFQRATGAPETEVAAESGNSVPAAGDLWSEAAAGLLHLPTFSMKGTVIQNI